MSGCALSSRTEERQPYRHFRGITVWAPYSEGDLTAMLEAVHDIDRPIVRVLSISKPPPTHEAFVGLASEVEPDEVAEVRTCFGAGPGCDLVIVVYLWKAGAKWRIVDEAFLYTERSRSGRPNPPSQADETLHGLASLTASVYIARSNGRAAFRG